VGFRHRVPVLVRGADHGRAYVLGEFNAVPVAVQKILGLKKPDIADVCINAGRGATMAKAEEQERDPLRHVEEVGAQFGVLGGGQVQAHVSSTPSAGW
jgi:hypothetical protein